jgi:hypothetical protein
MSYSVLQSRTHIRVSIKGGDRGTLKVVWDDPDYPPFDSYNIDEETLKTDASAVRVKLGLLVDHLMRNPAAPFGALLRDLAYAGRELYDDLFLDAGSSVQDVTVVRRWLEERTEPPRLTFIVDSYVHVPWGLVFDSNPDEIPDSASDIATYRDFWCLKYLGSGLIDQSQKATAAAIQIADK